MTARREVLPHESGENREVHCVLPKNEAAGRSCKSADSSAGKKAVVMALHRGTARKMTCPFCGKRAYHQKVLAR
jgi:hypothetical protein